MSYASDLWLDYFKPVQGRVRWTDRRTEEENNKGLDFFLKLGIVSNFKFKAFLSV